MGRNTFVPSGLALVARTTTSLLNFQTAQFQEEPTRVAANFKLVLAGTALSALRTLRPTALRACRASPAWPVSTTTSPPPPQALSGCSRQRAALTTRSRAP